MQEKQRRGWKFWLLVAGGLVFGTCATCVGGSLYLAKHAVDGVAEVASEAFSGDDKPDPLRTMPTSSASVNAPASPAMAEGDPVADWMNANSIHGKLLGLHAIDPWACGQRYAGVLDGSDHVFYIANGSVVGVYVIRSNERVPLWQDDQKLACDAFDGTVKVRPSSTDLPSYSIAGTTRLASGGVSGEVIVKSMSKRTPPVERERVLREIMNTEGLTQASIYCSEAARRADYSASFSRKHPKARECMLGGIVSNQFIE